MCALRSPSLPAESVLARATNEASGVNLSRNQKWKLIRKCLSDGRVAAFIHLADAFIQNDL